MANLKNSIIFILLFFLSNSCVSKNMPAFSVKSFSSKHDTDAFQVITVSSDRIRQECVFPNAEAENNWRHFYFIYILNENDEVIPIQYPLDLSKNSCNDYIKKVEKIYNKSSEVKICLRGNLSVGAEFPKKINFGKLGLHTTNYDELFFEAICNTKDCFSHTAYINTCPGFAISNEK